MFSRFANWQMRETTMTTTSPRGSAKIYQFPVRARAGQRGANPAVAEMAAARLPRVEFGSGWYHEAAIEEERSRLRDGH
jgi:hypothetical protein